MMKSACGVPWRLGCAVWLAVIAVLSLAACACGHDFAAPSSASDVAPSEVDDRLVAADNEFGFRLFSELVSDGLDENVFVSPMSVAFALSMTLNGAAGETYREMSRVLRVEDLGIEEINEANAGLLQALSQADPKVEISVANSLWAKKDIPFVDGFLQANESYYGAQVTTLDLEHPDAVNRINDWAGEATRDRIPEVIDEIPEEAVLFLIDAVHLKGRWTRLFREKLTQPGSFTLLNGAAKTVSMMHRRGEWDYLSGDGFQAIRLPYGGGRLGMLIFLPERDSSLDEFLSVLSSSPDIWTTWLSRFETQSGDVALPRFRVEYEADLAAVLARMGMDVAFRENEADFSRMVRGLVWIGEVRHKTFAKIDEQGTEAAASTVVDIHLAAEEKLTAKWFSMVIDRPFFFAIQDNETGAILFLGAVVEPL
jgi:serine protease inhibitor